MSNSGRAGERSAGGVGVRAVFVISKLTKTTGWRPPPMSKTKCVSFSATRYPLDQSAYDWGCLRDLTPCAMFGRA